MALARARPDLVKCNACGARRQLEAFPKLRNGQPGKTCRGCRRALARLRRITRALELVVCMACKVARPRSDFYSGHQKCKGCRRALAWSRRRARREAVPG